MRPSALRALVVVPCSEPKLGQVEGIAVGRMGCCAAPVQVLGLGASGAVGGVELSLVVRKWVSLAGGGRCRTRWRKTRSWQVVLHWCVQSRAGDLHVPWAAPAVWCALGLLVSP